MIDPRSRSLEWLQQIKKTYPRLDTQLVEKSIRAFSLLESLVLSGCPFIFKGGTATMLHLECKRRISIDVDIVCRPGTDIEQYVRTHAKEYGFTDVKLEERNSPHNVPKSHGKFYYQVTYNSGHQEDTILLDVLFEENHYSKVEELPIANHFLIPSGEPALVHVPSVEDILGDKLTAFAPHTTGVPFFKGKKDTTMEVIKQMYDVASLFDIAVDFKRVEETFRHFAPVEMGYRDLDLQANDILDDTINTALCLSLRGSDNHKDFPLLQRGVLRIKGHVIGETYTIEQAIRDASKAAYLATGIKYGIQVYEHYLPEAFRTLNNRTIGVALPSKLNKLKKTNPEAFFYWVKVEDILLVNRNSDFIR